MSIVMSAFECEKQGVIRFDKQPAIKEDITHLGFYILITNDDAVGNRGYFF